MKMKNLPYNKTIYYYHIIDEKIRIMLHKIFTDSILSFRNENLAGYYQKTALATFLIASELPIV